MAKDNKIAAKERKEIARFCACFANPTILAVLEELSRHAVTAKNDFIQVEGLSQFTVQMNLKYLKKFGLVTGSLSPETPYTINYEKLEADKKLFDAYYLEVIKSRKKQKL